MTCRTKSQQGMGVILLAIGVSILMGLISVMNTFTAGSLNKQTVTRINKVESYYLGEIAAWQNVVAKGASGTIVNYDNNYLGDLPNMGSDSCGPSVPGCPRNCLTTKNFDTESGTTVTTTFRRYTGRNLAFETKSSSYCGTTEVGKRSLHTCLATAAGGGAPPPPLSQLQCATAQDCPSITGWNTIVLPSSSSAQPVPANFFAMTSGNYYKLEGDIHLSGVPGAVSLSNVVIDGGNFTIYDDMDDLTCTGNCCGSISVVNSELLNLNIKSSAHIRSLLVAADHSCFQNVTYQGIPPLINDVPVPNVMRDHTLHLSFPGSHGGPMVGACGICS